MAHPLGNEFPREGFVQVALEANFADCDVVVLCVSLDADVLENVNALAEVLKPGAIVIDPSTVAVETARRSAATLAVHDIAFLDAPVSGGAEGARNGKSSVMVGGDAAALDRARPVLEAFGKTVVHVGPSGSGQLVKLVNQILVAGSMLSMAEALLFAQASGLDLEKTLEVVTAGAANSWTLENRGPMLARRDFRPGFTVDLQQKDLRLVLEAGSRTSSARMTSG